MKTRILNVCLFATMGMFLTGALQAASICFAIDENNMLYRFTSDAPGTTTSAAVTGLPMGYRLVGIDFRTTVRPSGTNKPGIGSLWALATDGSTLRLYSINPNTAAATSIGALTGMATSGSDNGWFFGFNPAKDTLEIMNFIDNYEVNPNTLAVTPGTKFNDPSANNPDNFPALNGSAYASAAFGGTSRIYFLDQGNDGLNTSNDISTGDFSAFPMPSNVSFSSPAGLDVDGNTMLMCGFDTMTSQQRLFSVNRADGTFTALGAISSSPASLILRALAIQPTTVSCKITKPKTTRVSVTKLVIKGTAASNAGIKAVQFRVNSGKFANVKGNLLKWRFTAKLRVGKNTISVRAVTKSGVTSKTQKIKITRLK